MPAPTLKPRSQKRHRTVPYPPTRPSRKSTKKRRFAIQFSKLWGLKKLREIAKRMDGRVRVAPFKVYPFPMSADASQFQGKPRLLVRTDEKGRKYSRLDWSGMTRVDYLTRSRRFQNNYSTTISPYGIRQLGWSVLAMIMNRRNKSFHARAVRDINNYLRMLTDKRDHPWTRVIIHPTHKRAQVAWTGRVTLAREDNSGISDFLKVTIELGYRRGESNFFQHPERITVLVPLQGQTELYEHINTERKKWVIGGILLRNKGKRKEEKIRTEAETLLSTLSDFLATGIRSHQIQPKNGREYLLRFNTFLNDPTTLEFYDLIEKRSPSWA